MKTNLDSVYKTDEKLEVEGRWIEFPNGAQFKLKRFGGMNSQKSRAILTKLIKPYTREIQLGTMDPIKDRKITATVFVRTCLVDWKGIESEGKEIPFSEATAIEILCDLPALLEELQLQAQSVDNYKEDLGNS